MMAEGESSWLVKEDNEKGNPSVGAGYVIPNDRGAILLICCIPLYINSIIIAELRGARMGIRRALQDAANSNLSIEDDVISG